METNLTDYLFVYFIGEGEKTKEQVYFSASRDGLHWKDLNKGNAVLISTLGTGGVRDPFILRSADGNHFYIIATDLCIGSGTTWDEAQYRGSKALIIWESDDLMNWSEPRKIEVATSGAGCVWAPEAIYDKETKDYLVFWASMVKLADGLTPKQRIYCAKTKDFFTFSKPEIYIERENHVIDTTIIEDNGIYYRYSKDETTKRIRIDYSNELLSSAFFPINSPQLDSLPGVEGPLIYKLNTGNAANDTWCLMVDQYAAHKGYLPLITDDLASGIFTEAKDYDLGTNLKRHGSVLRLTSEEYEKLLSKWS